MATYAGTKSLNVNQVRESGKQLADMASQYTSLAIDVGLAVGGAVPVVGWGADLVSLGRSAWKLDGWGVLFDLIGFVPVLGDGAKGAKVLDTANDLRRVVDQTLTGMAKVFTKTEDMAADFWKSKRNMDAYNDAMKKCGTADCYKTASYLKGPQYKNLPVGKGQWRPPESRGDGLWEPDAGSKLHTFLSKQDPPKVGVEFENGFPKFDDFSQGDIKIPMTGNHKKDFDLADDLYRKQLDNPDWKRPKGMTWHHKQDGTTMQLVPEALNRNVNHMGGAALFREGKPLGDEF